MQEMFLMPVDDIPSQHRISAQQVSDYLINLRGGAPFLSGADVRLLVQWLDDEIPVAAILCAMDKVALKRREKRVKTRMSLNVCKGTLNKLLFRKEAVEQSLTQVDEEKEIAFPGLLLWAQKIKKSLPQLIEEYPQGNFAKEQMEMIRSLEGLAHQNLNRDDTASKAIALISDFHEQAWREYGCHQSDFIVEAEEELENLRNFLTGSRWNEAVEEVARDRLRMRFPLLCAHTIWDILNGVYA